MSLGRFGGAYAALHAGHTVGDYWTQTDKCAQVKGKPGWDGQIACATHVATLTATQGVFLGLAVLASGERLSWHRMVAGLTVNAVSHYVADRRTPLRRLAGRLSWIGKDAFYAHGDGLASGAYVLDQAYHHGCDTVAVLIIAGGSRGR